MWEHKYTVSEY
ncbi:hypothetical protein HZS_7805 [Henneguya salminicola]|nr:hypothetical protein HZS_7805 [Henneguya salminicola]